MNKLKFVLIAIFALCGIACNNAPSSNQTANTAAPSSIPSATTTENVNTNAAPVADNLAFARANYAQHCVACHGEKGDGGVIKIEDLKLKVPSLKEGHATKHTDEKLAKQINNGGDGMPAFKDKLKPEEITDLVRFVRQEFQGSATQQTTTATAPKS